MVKMWSHRKPYTLVMGMQKFAATLENSMAISNNYFPQDTEL